MSESEADIRPETYALDALIRETLARGGSTSAADALLFLGTTHHAFPALVVRDPVLEPVDKLVWMVVYQSARGTGSKAVFPSYADIARFANVSSSSTVSRAIAILRATRWLSLCARGRDTNGRFAGNVYALHDEPLPCVFRRNWSDVPGQTGHAFRSKAVSCRSEATRVLDYES